MKRTIVVCGLVVLLGSAPASAQFRTQAEEESRVSQSIYSSGGSSWLFGWFDPGKFSMHHSIEMSYMTLGGGEGFSLGTYTNSMRYEFAPNLNVRTDVSVSYSPFQSVSNGFGGQRNDLSKIYLSRAEVNYRPWENTVVQLSYRQYPYSPYGMFSQFHDPWYREGGF
jgi:hypothetical protein